MLSLLGALAALLLLLPPGSAYAESPDPARDPLLDPLLAGWELES